MTVFLKILLNNILPPFIIIAAGVLADRTLKVDKKSVSRLAIYLFTPTLVFTSISQSKVAAGQFGLMVLYVVVLTAILCGVALAVGKALRWPARSIDALVLSIAFLNAGNFGLSVLLMTFGDAGVELGAVFFVASNLVCNTVAAFFATRSNGSPWKALLSAFKLPGVYAFVLAMLLRSLHLSVPAPLFRPIELVSKASVPSMLLLLGIQLSQTRVGKRYKGVALGVGLRLVVGALIAVGLAPVMGLTGLARSVAIVEASTPTAVNSGLLAIEFDADAEYVSSVIFFSTLLSSITMTVILSVLV